MGLGESSMFYSSFRGWERAGVDFHEEGGGAGFGWNGCVNCYSSVVYNEIPAVHNDCNMNYVK